MPLFLVFVAFALVLWWALRAYDAPARRATPRDPRGAGGDAARAAAASAPVRTRAEALRVLDLPDAATADEVEERYRTLRRTTHPDNFPRSKYPPAFVDLAEAEFKRLGEARDVLLGRRR